MSMAIRDTGLYSEEVALNPHKITNSKTWTELMEIYISDDDLSQKHKELLNATRLDHMVFVTGPRDEKEALRIDDEAREKATKEGKEYKTIDYITDEDIRQMLADVSCKVRRIVHSETARHVYFWSADNKSRKDAIEMGYKLKGRFGTDDGIRQVQGNTYNIIFSAPVQEKVRAIEAELKNMLIKPNDIQTN